MSRQGIAISGVLVLPKGGSPTRSQLQRLQIVDEMERRLFVELNLEHAKCQASHIRTTTGGVLSAAQLYAALSSGASELSYVQHIERNHV